MVILRVTQMEFSFNIVVCTPSQPDEDIFLRDLIALIMTSVLTLKKKYITGKTFHELGEILVEEPLNLWQVTVFSSL